MHPSAAEGNNTYLEDTPNTMPLQPSFTSFLNDKCPSSPTKKQKLQEIDRRRLKLSPVNDTDDDSEYSCSCGTTTDDFSPLVSPPVASCGLIAPAFPQLAFPSTPSKEGGDQRSPSTKTTTTPNGKRPFPEEDAVNDEFGNDSQTSSPFGTPQGRKMLQNLCINGSPSPTLSSVSPTPESGSTIRSQLIHQELPNMPTFSFSPSLNLGNNTSDGINDNREVSGSATLDSSVRETIAFSMGSAVFGTPKKAPRGLGDSASSSPLHSLRGNRTPIGCRRGSVFNALPPRIYPNGREDSSVGGSTVQSMAENSLLCSSPYTSSPSPHVAPSYTSSPSPRMVPLTVLSGNGQESIEAQASFDQSTSSRSATGMPSPLMRSLDRGEEGEGDLEEFLSPKMLRDISMPNITTPQESPLSAASSRLLLPKIKLTPRGKNKKFVSPSGSLKLSPRAEFRDGSINMPRMPSNKMQHNNTIESASSSIVQHSTDDEEAAEMDSLLNGFELHKTSQDNNSREDSNPGLDLLGRVESEEEEMVALTQDNPFQTQNIWLPPTVTRRKSGDDFEIGMSPHLSPGDEKPMPLITLGSGQSGEEGVPCLSPSFLPRPVPASNSSRSLFNSNGSLNDPFERILHADFVAEAAKSDEPLTDDEEDEEEDTFLLRLPQSNQGKDAKTLKTVQHTEKKLLKSSSTSFRTESPYFNRRAESPSLRVMRRNKWSDLSMTSPTTPTIFEDGLAPAMNQHATIEGSSSQTSLHVPKTETFATLCSLSDCDASEVVVTSPKNKKALCSLKGRQSVTSLLSMTSLCGLNIVHEAGLMEDNKVSVVMSRSESSEFSASLFRPLGLVRSEFSMNSLGLSVDSDIDQRELFTPPVISVRKQMLTPPQLPKRTGAKPL